MDVEDAANPTSFLPPLLRISSQSSQDISYALKDLRKIYSPHKTPTLPSIPKRTIDRLDHDPIPDSGYASAEEDSDETDTFENAVCIICQPPQDDHLEVLRADIAERDFVLRWITGFIARSDAWINCATSTDDRDARSCLLDDATAILSAFVGRDEEDAEDREHGDQAILRHFSFLTPNGDPLAVELRDAPLLDDDYTSVGLQSWGSSIYLGRRLCETPVAFSLMPAGMHLECSIPLRVLELGAGTGLLSIIAAKLLSGLVPPPTIVASDYHPEVLTNLPANIRANFPHDDTLPISVHELDWERPLYNPPLDTPFDVVLAADVVYHPDHARWIKGCVERVLKRPCPVNCIGGIFWMIIALRPAGRHERLDESVTATFSGETKTDSRPALVILEAEDIAKSEGVGRADESGYRLFKIGWDS